MFPVIASLSTFWGGVLYIEIKYVILHIMYKVNYNWMIVICTKNTKITLHMK